MPRAVLAVALLCAATPLPAQEEAAQRPPEHLHQVRPGDTLWELARRYLSDPFLWPEIFRLNAERIRDPDRIHPSEPLRIPWLGAGSRTLAEVEPERTIFFRRETDPSPEVSIIRPAGTAEVPILTPGDFYRAAFLAHDREVAPVGRIVRRISPSVVPVELPDRLALHDRVMVALAPRGTTAVGEQLQFFRRGCAVRGYGRVWEPTGLARVLAVEDGMATVVIVQLFAALTVGDLALPAEEFSVRSGVTPLPGEGIGGKIVAFQQPSPLPPIQAMVFLDLGARAGIEAGDEFVAYLPAQQRSAQYRPEVAVARLQVVRVRDDSAAARILELWHPALAPGIPVRLVGKMP